MPEGIASAPWWVVVGLIATIGYAVIRFARWTGRVDTRLDNLDTRLGNLAETVQKGFAEVRADIKKILERSDSRHAVEAHSPIQLTEFGREISVTGSASEWARTHAPSLVPDTAGKEEFEIFDLCVEYVAERFANDTGFRRAIAYQHGTELEQVLKVYQVELRDRLLKPDT